MEEPFLQGEHGVSTSVRLAVETISSDLQVAQMTLTATHIPGRRELSTERAGLSLIVVAYLIAVLLPLQLSLGGTILSSVRIVVVLAVIPLAVGLIRGRYGPLLPTDWLFFAHTVWMGVSIGVMTPSMAVSQFGSVGSEFLGGYLIGRALIRTPDQFRKLLLVVGSMIMLLIPVTLFEMLTGQAILIDLLKKVPLFSTVGHATTEARLGLNRAQVVFSHPIHWGLFASSLFSLLLIGLQGSVPLSKRLALAGAAALGTYSSLSSGALLPLILQIVLIGWAFATRSLQRRWWILIALVVCAWTMIELLSDRSAMMAVLTRLAFSSHNVYWRSIIFDWGWMNIFGSSENGIPSARLFGLGLNEWVRPIYMSSSSIDNFWLLIGVRHGIPGFLAVAGGFVLLIWKVARRDFGDDIQLNHMRLAWVITFVSLGLSLGTVHIWGSIYSYTFFLLGAGAWLSSIEPNSIGSNKGDEGKYSAPQARQPSYTRFGQAGDMSDWGSPQRTYARLTPALATRRP